MDNLLLAARLKDERGARACAAAARRHQPGQRGVERLQETRAARQARYAALLQRLVRAVGGAFEAATQQRRRAADDGARARARRRRRRRRALVGIRRCEWRVDVALAVAVALPWALLAAGAAVKVVADA